jgi:co-chaperonin GroES (HSP10)
MTGLNVAEVVHQESGMKFAFPDIDCGMNPYGSRIIVQIRTPRTMTEGGIVIPHEARETEKWNTQVAKVIKLGPVAFKNRDTLEPWKEGAWCQPGTFVRVPKYGGDRWEVPVPGLSDPALFCVFNDLDIIGEFTGDPLTVKAFI